MTAAQTLRLLHAGLSLAALLLLAACSAEPGPRFDAPVRPSIFQPNTAPAIALPKASGDVFGTGPVRVALLLPLSGDPALASVGLSMANAARLAISDIEGSGSNPHNITLVLKDTGPTAAGAAQAASQAVSEGASLILGPLKADQVTAAGSVAHSAGIPLIGFSNNSAVASPGVYLLNVLPDGEVFRSISYVQKRGKRGIAAIFPATEYGRIQEAAFRHATTSLGLATPAVYEFSSEAEARGVVQQLTPLLQSGQIDALFIPDRATAPSFGVLLEQAAVPQGTLQIIGSVDWDNDIRIVSTPYLSGAIYPAVDSAGLQALQGPYQQKFGSAPHPLSTSAYTAVVLANSPSLALGTPRYDRAQLTKPSGFAGRDGQFRFLGDGRSETALVIKQVGAGGASVVDGARL